MNRFLFKKEFSVGELLTFLSIAGSAVSILWSWNNDRSLRIRENADKIRIEAAAVMGKLQRIQDIYISFYDEIQVDIQDVSETLSQSHSTMVARDLFWKRFQQRKAETQRRILDEQLETAYIGLLPFDTGIDSLYTTSMLRLKKLNANLMRMHLQESEAFVLDFKGSTSQTAVLGNELRGIAARYREEHSASLSKGSLTLETHLKALIRSPDKTLLEHGDL